MSVMESITECQSPRISFSLNLSQNDRISPDNRKREDVTNVHYDTDFEFCVVSNDNYGHSFFEEALLSVTDGLLSDGKILPVDRPTESQPMTIASHLSLAESSRYQSPVRSASYPPSGITSSCVGIGASKCSRQKPPSKWKEIMLKLSNKESAENRRTSSQDRSGNNVKQQPSSPRSTLLPFSRSSSTGDGEMKKNTLFCPLPFSRSQSAAERKHKATNNAACYSSHRSPGRVDGNERSMVRNLVRSSGNGAKASSFDSPRPGKPMVKLNSIGGVSPVLNVVACIGSGHVGGNWKGGGGLFGFFPKREKKQPSAYHFHQSHACTNRQKGA